MHQTSSAARIAAVVTLLLAGILAGAQLGKIAPLAGWYRSEAGFSLVLVGWLTSLIGVFVALVALPAGWAIGRVGARGSALAGSVLLAAGAFALPLLRDPAAILGARVVEGAGYVILVIALPAVLTAVASPRYRGAVLAVWSCFVPVGYAVSDLAAQLLLPRISAPAYMLAMAIAFAALAAAGLALLARVADAPAAGQPVAAAALGASLSLPVASIAAAFGLFVVQSLALFAFLPVFINAGAPLLLSAGAIALFTPLGNAVAGALVIGAAPRRVALLAALAFAATAAAGWYAFAGTGGLAVTAAAALFVATSGLVGSALYAAIPALVPPGGSVPVAIGLVAQAGGIGTLLGPPAAAYVIEQAGWPGLGVFLAIAGVAGIVALLPNLAGPQRA